VTEAADSASRGCADANPIAIRVGENGEGWCSGFVDDGPAGSHGCNPLVGHFGCEPQIEVPALAGRVVVVGALEPHGRDPTGGVEDGVIDLVVRAARQEDRPERSDLVLVRGIECDLKLQWDRISERSPGRSH
jgi:hypothetical protein